MTEDEGIHPKTSGSIRPDRWNELLPQLDRVLDAPLSHRRDILTEICQGDSELMALLEKMAAECNDEVPFLNGAALDRFEAGLDGEGAPEGVALRAALGGHAGRLRHARQLLRAFRWDARGERDGRPRGGSCVAFRRNCDRGAWLRP